MTPRNLKKYAAQLSRTGITLLALMFYLVSYVLLLRLVLSLCILGQVDAIERVSLSSFS